MSVLISLLGGGFMAAVVSLIVFFVERRDEKVKQHDELVAEIKELKNEYTLLKNEIHAIRAENAEERAVTARVRILRFEDDLQDGKHPSKESFQQVLRHDITVYNNYCELHPEFKNNQTVVTVAHIEKVYNEKLSDGSFNNQ